MPDKIHQQDNTKEELKRKEISAALLRIAASVVAYDPKEFMLALKELHELTHPKKPEEK